MNDILTRNSDTHPLRIDCVQPDGGWGLIGLSFCPGKKEIDVLTGHWHRDLSKDLTRIREWGATMVISLIEDREFGELQVEALPDMVEHLGMRWLHLPIRHRFPPGKHFDALWANTSEEILNRLQAGQRIFLHGKGGLGRTGSIAACLLIESGISPEEAIAKVRAARPNTIETAVQEWRVMVHQPILPARKSLSSASDLL